MGLLVRVFTSEGFYREFFISEVFSNCYGANEGRGFLANLTEDAGEEGESKM